MTAVYVFGGIMAILIVAVIFAPLIEDRARSRTASQATASGRKEAAIEALRELEFEYQTGKLAEEDYRQLRARYARTAIAARDELGEEAEPGACPACGASSAVEARFCARCGAKLDGEGGA